MTVVEFFDGVSIHNMVSCMTLKPDKVIFIGERKPMKKHEQAYLRFVKQQKIEVVFEFRSIQRNSLEQIIGVLEGILEEEELQKEESWVFDLTGGDDLVLVAMGIVYERHKNHQNIQMHRFNIRSGVITDCDHDGIVPIAEMPRITVEDQILLYGGSVLPRDGEGDIFFAESNEDFADHILQLWEICRKEPELWNSQVSTLAQMAAFSRNAVPDLHVSVNKAELQAGMRGKPLRYVWNSNMVKELKAKNFLVDVEEKDGLLSFAFKNELTKQCLTKAGTLLELVVAYYAKTAESEKGEPVYQDVITGVYIDWDGKLHHMDDAVKDTINEIDVILMKGMVPVFISCKNGAVDQNELYKLHTVAERFGGPYVKKALVITYYGKEESPKNQYFLQRAKDMGIQVIKNAHELDAKEFMERIISLGN